MRTRFGRAAWILAALALGWGGIAAGQDALDSSSTDTIDTNLTPEPSALADFDSVNSSLRGSLPLGEATGAALSNIAIDSSVSASSDVLSAGQSSGNSLAHSGVAAAFGVPSTGWGAGSSMTGASNSGFGMPQRSGDQTAKGSGRGLSKQGNHGSFAQHPVLTSGPARQKTGSPNASAGISAGQTPDLSTSRKRFETQGAGTGQSAGVTNPTYSRGFADSTRGTAVLSPPDAAASRMFAFDPEVSRAFTDLADHEFLAPSLHAESRSAASVEKPDLHHHFKDTASPARSPAGFCGADSESHRELRPGRRDATPGQHLSDNCGRARF
jgi:hypothetical protein